MIKWFKRKKKTSPESRQENGPENESGLEEAGEEQDGQKTFLEAQNEPEAEATEPEGAFEFGESEAGLAPEDEELAESPDFEEEGEEEDLEQRKGRFFKRLRARLHKTRERFVDRVDNLVLGKKVIDLDLLDELEEVLITSDLGVRTTQLLLQKVTEKIKRKELQDPSKLREQLRDEIRAILSIPAPAWDIRANHPFMVMVIGVNGVGKTTTIGKLAHHLKAEGMKVMLAAADTFRAAAVEQLSLWSERVGVPIIKQKSGSDPSAVAFDAIEAAIARDIDLVLLDTAGRMHTKVNLMEELKKIQRVVGKKMESAPHEILLVLDATTGQNALSQARLFKEAIGVTGLILTKLDGTAKGGIIVAICEELQVPVRYIGIGEGMEDLRPFDADEFTKALF